MDQHMFRTTRMLLMAIVISGCMVYAQHKTNYVDISFNIISPITLHEPVVVDVAIRNLVSRPISIDLGPLDKWFFHFLTITPDGKHIDITNEGRDVTGRHLPIYLTSNQIYSQRLILDELYAFDELGKYSMTASAQIPIAMGKVSLPYPLDKAKWAKVETAKAKLELVILPRNEAALRKRCEALSAKVLEAEGWVPHSVAEELSYVTDPIAIPYISRLIEKREEWSALEGLRRINTDEAWEAMIPIIYSQADKSTAAYARQILREKLPEIRDPKIKKKIADAVQ